MHINPSNRSRLLPAFVSLACLACATRARADELLRWKFKLGQKLHYDAVQDMTLAFPQASVKTHQEIDATCDVLGVNEEGDAVIRLKFNRMKMKAVGPRSFECDSKSETPPTGYAALIAPVFKAMTDGEFEMTMTARGEVKDFKMPEQVVTALKNLPNAASLGDIANPDGLKNMIFEGALVLPKDPPKVGETWTTKTETKNPTIGRHILETTYRYNGTKEINGTICAVIQPQVKTEFGKSDPAPAENASKKSPPQPSVQTKVKDQKSESEVLFNIKDGRLYSRFLKRNVTIEETAGGKTEELKIDQMISLKETPVGGKQASEATKPKASAQKTK